MFLSTNALNADSNLTYSFSLLKYCHIILTKEKLQSAASRVSVYYARVSVVL